MENPKDRWTEKQKEEFLAEQRRQYVEHLEQLIQKMEESGEYPAEASEAAADEDSDRAEEKEPGKRNDPPRPGGPAQPPDWSEAGEKREGEPRSPGDWEQALRDISLRLDEMENDLRSRTDRRVFHSRRLGFFLGAGMGFIGVVISSGLLRAVTRFFWRLFTGLAEALSLTLGELFACLAVGALIVFSIVLAARYGYRLLDWLRDRDQEDPEEE